MEVCTKLIILHHVFSLYLVPIIINLKTYHWSHCMSAGIHACLLYIGGSEILDILYTISMVILIKI